MQLATKKVYELSDPSKAKEIFEGWEQSEIYACLQNMMGKIYVTDQKAPKSAIAFIGDFAFYAGKPDRTLVSAKPKNGVIMVPKDEDWAALIESCFPGAEELTRYAIKRNTRFQRETLERLVAALPNGYELRKIDGILYDMCLADPDFKDFVSVFDSKERYLELGRGRAVLKDGKIVAGASSYARYREGFEIEVDTAKAERRKGLASAACAALILDSLEEGLYPSWDAANMNSVHLAEKLGYEFDHAYVAYWVI